MTVMDHQFAPYVKLSEHDRPSDAPCLVLELKAGPKLWEASPYHIFFTIRRVQDGHDKPCIFLWDPVTDGLRPWGFVLLHHTVHGGLEKIEVRNVGVLVTPDVLLVNGYTHFLWELPPAGSVTFKVSLPKSYRESLVPGERYELIWPGGEIALWDWGTTREHLKQELKPKLPSLVLPGGPRVSFTVEQGDRPKPVWRRPVSPPPIEPSARVPGAPVLSVQLECTPTLTHTGPLDVTVKVIYHGLADGTEQARPITFHIYAFKGLHTLAEGFRLYRHCNGKWETYYDNGETGFNIYDDPDIPVNVTQDKDFVSLRPGECWTTSCHMQDTTWTNLPDDRAVRDVFRFRYKGGIVDWWDWGGSEEHANTVVKLPCWRAGNVTNPADNGGRPKLVVPASNVVEFTIME